MLREQNLFEDLGALPVFAPEKAVAFGVESHGDKVFGRILIPAEVNEGDRSPVVLLLHGYPGLERNMDIPYAFRRAGIAAAYLTAEATAQGLGSCILGWLDDEKLRDICGLEYPVRLVITLGYATQEKLRTKKRKEMTELVKEI